MFKEYIVPFDPPPPFDPEVGFSPKIEQLRKLLADYNKLSALEQRLGFDALVEILDLDIPALAGRFRALEELYPYMEPMVFAYSDYWLISIELAAVCKSSLILRAEYQSNGLRRGKHVKSEDVHHSV